MPAPNLVKKQIWLYFSTIPNEVLCNSKLEVPTKNLKSVDMYLLPYKRPCFLSSMYDIYYFILFIYFRLIANHSKFFTVISVDLDITSFPMKSIALCHEINTHAPWWCVSIALVMSSVTQKCLLVSQPLRIKYANLCIKILILKLWILAVNSHN